MNGLTTRTRRYTWDKGKPTETRGVFVYSATGRAFIPENQLTNIADELVDHHEEYNA